MGRLNKEREKKLTITRTDTAVKALQKLGFVVGRCPPSSIRFVFNDSIVEYFPYSGWATGKTIKDGRGLHNLLKQVKNVDHGLE